MPYLPATPGERIGDLRTARHMTRKKLAARIGVDPATVSRIESGVTRTINDETVRKLARVFNVSAEFILCETDEPDKTNFVTIQSNISYLIKASNRYILWYSVLCISVIW